MHNNKSSVLLNLKFYFKTAVNASHTEEYYNNKRTILLKPLMLNIKVKQKRLYLIIQN